MEGPGRGVALGALAAGPLHAAGFSIFEQGTKAMGMAGAFTAQADDPSLLFYNAGGLAFVDRAGLLGRRHLDQGPQGGFRGRHPVPGRGLPRRSRRRSPSSRRTSTSCSRSTQTWKFGLGIETPFGLTTEWENPDQFAGRFLCTKAALRAFDLNPTIGWQVTPTFGIGFGAIARVSDVELNRNIAAINPFTQQVVDVGRLKLEADFSEGYGYNVGILHKFDRRASPGASPTAARSRSTTRATPG